MKSTVVGNSGHGRGIKGKLLFGLITQRSKVQILPPQPSLKLPSHNNFKPDSELVPDAFTGRTVTKTVTKFVGATRSGCEAAP